MYHEKGETAPNRGHWQHHGARIIPWRTFGKTVSEQSRFWPPVQMKTIQVDEQRLCFKKQTKNLKNWKCALKDEQKEELKNILTKMQ